MDMDQQLFLVADGMGGLERGEHASDLAVSLIPQLLKEKLATEDCAEAIEQTLIETNAAILDAARQLTHTGRMGTTVVLALYRDSQVWVAGIGDSPAYFIRGREVRRLTTDHSLAQCMVLRGVLDPAQARISHYRHILHSYLGSAWLSKESIDVVSLQALPGDWLLLGSDGLTNMLGEDDFQQDGQLALDPQASAEALMQTAVQRGSRDNITCVIISFGSVC